MAREFDTQIKFGVTDNATQRIRALSAELRGMSSAHETIGIKSERNIQREIARTIASYNRLERSGSLSANEQIRAYDKMQFSIARLRQQMAGAERQLRSWGKAAFAIGSGIAAVAITLRKPINDQASYSMHLAELSNLAFNKEDVAARITGKKQLDASIRRALRSGGDTPEQGFAALQSMIRSGSMTVTEAQQLLPGVMMNASATGSDP